jgi:putative addiction module component (TIGR02574 family)
MGRNLKELFREAAQLPDEDRAALAGLLLESIEPGPEADVEAAWSAEIERRVTEINSGAIEMIPWEQVRKELFRGRE